MKQLSIYAFLLFGLLFASCGNEDEPPPPPPEPSPFDTGIIVCNQGKINEGTGTLSWINNGQVDNDIYQDANDGEVLGNVVQSIIQHDLKFFIAVNNGGKVVITDKFLVKEAEIAVDQPRYFAVADDSHVLVSYWGPDGYSGGVHKISTETNSIVATLETGGAPEEIKINDGKAYVVMSNGFVGPGQSVKVLNINDLSEENSIAVAKGAASMDFDSDNNAWVSSTEAWDSPNGFLTKIAPDASVSSQEITSGSTSLAVVDGALYYTTGSALESMNLSTNEVNTLTPGFFYGKAHSSDGNIYLSSPGDFASPAYVIKTDQNGMVLDTFDVGITPGFIYISE